MEADLSDLSDSCFLISLETFDLFSDTHATEFLVLCELEDVSFLVCCKDPLLLIMAAAENDEGSRLILYF